jgi:hypothetical protein
MNLETLIDRLGRLDPDANIRLDDGCTPTRLISYRGHYDQLAIDYKPTDPTAPMKVSALLADAEAAVGKTFTGYKGGEYVMHSHTPVWVSRYGDVESRAITAIDDGGKVARIITVNIEDYA